MPVKTTSRTPQVVANYHCDTGENPLWDPKKGIVYWTDIPRGRLFLYDTRTGEHRQFYAGEQVGGFTLQEDGSLALFQANKISTLQPGRAPRAVTTNIDPDMDRFNDVIADPRGRVFAGTIGRDNEKGGLYRVDTDGRVTCLFKMTRTTNGMGFTPDRRHFYWTDTTHRRIYRFAYDEASGALSDRKVWLEIPEGQGGPDGLTVDSEGCVWSARWDGFALFRYSPKAELMEKIPFPVGKVSSVIFGGPRMDQLYVTTAGGTMGSSTLDGALFTLDAGVQGLPEFRSKVPLQART